MKGCFSIKCDGNDGLFGNGEKMEPNDWTIFVQAEIDVLSVGSFSPEVGVFVLFFKM